MISQETIETIISTAKIEEVVGDFVSLRKKGNNFTALCPFHNEKTPSFIVSPAKDIYKCFGCGKAGNSVKFLMEYEKYTYPEALRFLAAKYNIAITEEKESEDQTKEKDELASNYIVLSFAEEFYHNFLIHSEEGKKIGQAYLKSRGISESTWVAFRLGFASLEKDIFSREAINKGYKEEYLISSGLSLKTPDGKLIDRFRDRIMFPIHSVTGRTLGFGGRALKTDHQEAKYINSPETKVYSKSKILFGLDLAKNHIQRADKCYLVEGYTDVLALFQSGILNVVASLGTSLTEEHVRLVKRYTNNLTFIFDGDEAGIKASLRGIDLALKEELNIKIIALPEGEDPDSFVKKNDNTEVNLYLKKNASDFIIFKTRFLFGNKSDDPIQKAEIVRNIIKSIINIPNFLKRSNYIKELAYELNLDESILYRELDNQLINARKSNLQFQGIKHESKEPERVSALDRYLKNISSDQEKQVIKLLLLKGNDNLADSNKFADLIIEVVADTEWENPLFSKIFNSYIAYRIEKKIYPEIKYFINHSDPAFQEVAINCIELEPPLSDNWKKRFGEHIELEYNYVKDINKTLNHYELRKLQLLKKKNSANLRKGDLSLMEEQTYQMMQIELEKKIREISNLLGVVIY